MAEQPSDRRAEQPDAPTARARSDPSADPPSESLSRRAFVQATASAAAVAAVGGIGIPRRLDAATPASADRAHAAGSDVIRVGVIGCGGRGTGAARDCMRGSAGVEVVALGDLFPDRLERCREQLAELAAEDADIASKLKVTPDRCFTGFDAYRRVLAADIDLVILATPPGFRPLHLRAAVDAGKHIFSEKPVAVDAAGVRSVLATYDAARQKGLAIGVGTQRRHQAEYLDTVQRIRDGAIGEVLSGQVFWNQRGLWSREHDAAWSDVEWQIRNWLYFVWLSGDHIVEQHVHNIDVANWVLGDHPERAVAVGGRQQRTEPRYGHIYDHFAVDFEYPGGAHVLSMCRQIEGTATHVGEHFIGTAGRADAAGAIHGLKAWRYEAPEQPVSPYVQEHTDLIAALRAGQPYNELKQIAESNLTAIMGREAAYTGQVVTWEDALNTEQELSPPDVAFGPLDVPPVAVPGRTRLNRSWNEGW